METKAIPKKRRKCLLWLAIAAICVAAAAIFLHIGSTRVVTIERQAHLPHLAAMDDGLRVAILSDPHFGPDDAGRAAMLAEKLNATDPDIIILLGDFVDGTPDHRKCMPMAELTRFARALRARCGVFAVTGNHELWYGRDEVVAALREGGATVLDNEFVTIATPSGSPLQIVGMPDYSTEEPPEKFPAIDRARPTLIMMHDANSARYVPEGVDGLILSGHTHGGQLRFCPDGGDRTSIRLAVLRLKAKLGMLQPRKDNYVLFDRGFTEYNGHRIFITSGTGLSRLRLRLFCPPEVVLLKLRSDPDAVKNTFAKPEELK